MEEELNPEAAGLGEAAIFKLMFHHQYVLNKGSEKCLKLSHPRSGRFMEASTTEPSLFLYSGDYIPNIKGKGGVMYNKRQGLALETAAYAHSINIDENDDTIHTKA